MTSTDSPEALKPCHYCGAEWFPQASSIQRHSWGIIHKETCEISIAAHAKLDRTERAALSPPSPDSEAVSVILERALKGQNWAETLTHVHQALALLEQD